MRVVGLTVAAVLVFLLTACGPCSNRCIVGWTYQYTPQGGGAGAWVMTPTYAQ